jgi:hypothetical protein
MHGKLRLTQEELDEVQRRLDEEKAANDEGEPRPLPRSRMSGAIRRPSRLGSGCTRAIIFAGFSRQQSHPAD